MRILVRIVLNGLGVLLISRLVPGIEWHGDLLYLLITGVVIGSINVFVKPLVTILSIPLIVVTLGLFYLAINGLMLILADYFLAGLSIQGCGPAVLGGLVLGIFNWVVSGIGKEKRD